ncbi:MAG TPA: cyclopropane-fatty-acyl-phospholipid synthase family protein [Rhizomicrobium sp.]|nr:cyclopropane-fatty-acyl-phospholipid synthase family protein [Rhizomicrobium sp.]
MVETASRSLPEKAEAIAPPFWGRAVMRATSNITEGELVLRFANGAERTISAARDGARAVLDVARDRVWRRLMLGGEIGIAEAFMDGDWTSPDLAAVFEFAARNTGRLKGALAGLAPLQWMNMLRHRMRANTRAGSRRNIAAHYDLGNAFYSQWLDPTMTYSSAVFERDDMSLEDAQRNKWRKLAEMLELRPGMRVLEIGCGWAGFAMFAAREYGAHVTGITLSHEQYAYGRNAVSKAGLADLIDIQLVDYRDVEGQFDRVASIEMFEAVGEEHWPVYFEVVRERLKPGGIAGLQIITIDDGRFDSYRRSADFIQLYIFPGGMLPSPGALEQASARQGLGFETVRTFALSYAETLRRWRETFDARWPTIQPLGFDERFKRMWDYYLASCEGGFRAGSIDVGQFRLTRA